MIRRAAAIALLFPALAAAAQDAARPPRIETWYQVRRGDEARGFAHELLVANGTSWAYFHEAAYTGDDDQPVALRAEGRLDARFRPLELRVTRNAAGHSTETTVSSSDRLRASLTGDGRDAGSIEAKPDDACLVFLPVTVYGLSAAGALDRPGKVALLRLDGGAETATVGKPEPATILGRKSVSLVRVTIGETEVRVDRYGRVVGQKMDGVEFAIAADQNAADPDGRVAGQWRRDPFLKTLTPVGRDVPPTATPAKADRVLPALTLSPDEIEPSLARAKALIAELRAHVAEERGREAGETYQAFLRLYEALRSKVAGDSVRLGPLDGDKAEAESLYGGADRRLARATELATAIEDWLNVPDVEQVKVRAAELRAMQNDREFINQPGHRAKVMELARVAEDSERRVVVRAALQRKHLELNGVVVAGDVLHDRITIDLGLVEIDEAVRLHAPRACAAINNETYREGDIVAGTGVRVERISRQGVSVTWEGETRELPLGKGR